METALTSWIDYVVIAVYFLCVVAISVLSMCRKNRESIKGYFLAGRTMHWIPIGASMYASNIGSKHFVGLAGSGAASGVAVVAFEWGSVVLLILLGWIFLPVYLTAQVFTIPEYLGRRFGGDRMRIYLSCVALVLYVLVGISVDVYAGGMFIQQATGWNLYLSMIPLLIITAIYTIAGGLAAVVFTDAFQTVVMFVGATALAVIAFAKVGGMEGVYEKYHDAVSSQVLTSYANDTSSNSTCGFPRQDAFHVFRDPVNSDLPWPGVIFRATVASLWYWCADQVIVQRALAARNMTHARAATLFAGFLKLSPLFLMVIPGMISRILYPDMVACADPETCMAVCNNPSGCSNVAYPLLILKLAPNGMRGLMLAVMMAALMSSLTSIFNSASTVFTMDIWRKLRPQASEKSLLVVGRLFMVALVCLSMAWIPLIVGSQKGQLFIYIQAVTGYLAPPICSVFLLALFVPRVNERGAFWGVLAGQATGLTRLVLDFVYPAPGCGQEDGRPMVVAAVNFTYFSAVVLTVTAVVGVLVSFTAPRQDEKEIEGLTWWTLRKLRQKQKAEASSRADSFVLNERKGDETTAADSPENALLHFPNSNPILNPGHDLPNIYQEQSKSALLLDQDFDKTLHATKTAPAASGSNQVFNEKSAARMTEAVEVEVSGGGQTRLSEVFSVEVPAPWSHVLNVGAVALVLCLAALLYWFA